MNFEALSKSLHFLSAGFELATVCLPVLRCAAAFSQIFCLSKYHQCNL